MKQIGGNGQPLWVYFAKGETVALIRFYKPTLRRKDMDAVLRTMVDEKIGPGERKNEFLKQFCSLVGLPHGMVLRSYVDALSSALRICAVGEGTVIGMSVLSPGIYRYVAESLGAVVKLGDIDPETGCLSQAEASRLVGEGAQVLLVHEPMCQIPFHADYRSLGTKVVEDISQSIGSSYEEQKAGQFGDVVVCAFEEDGIVSAGGGAGIAFSADAFSAPLRKLYGPTRQYQELPDMNAALGIVQIATVEEQLAKRRELFSLLRKSLQKTSHSLFGIGNIDYEPNGYGFCVVLDSKPEDAIKFAGKYQVPAKKTFAGCVGSDLYDRFDLFPAAIPPLLRALSFPIYPFLKQGDLEMLMKVLSHLP
jgi:dTDP-4-amino-4,6-dideoxygalactose transaminase